jgi:hypothetical protein
MITVGASGLDTAAVVRDRGVVDAGQEMTAEWRGCRDHDGL